MKFNLSKEITSLLFVLLSFAYLGVIWKDLPDEVPIHWNSKGEIDQYGSKRTLIILPLVLPLLTYLIFLVVPFIDPKKKVHKMGKKYHQLKNILVMFSTILCLFFFYLTKNESTADLSFLLAAIGFLYAAFGNYFKTLQPNYFIGVRTPWTLESEVTWRKTHYLSGIIWFIGGILLVISGFLLPDDILISVLVVVTIILIAVPVIYSFITFKKIKSL